MGQDENINYVIGIAVIIVIVFAFGYFGIRYVKDYVDNVFSSLVKNNTQNKPQLIINNDKNPVISFVSETEYSLKDGSGSTIIKLVDYKGDKINTTCWEKILYPDKTTYIDWSEMTSHMEYSNYYFNFNIPDIIGIYDQEVRCLVNNKNISLGKGFHVSNITNVIDELKQDVMVVVT